MLSVAVPLTFWITSHIKPICKTKVCPKQPTATTNLRLLVQQCAFSHAFRLQRNHMLCQAPPPSKLSKQWAEKKYHTFTPNMEESDKKPHILQSSTHGLFISLKQVFLKMLSWCNKKPQVETRNFQAFLSILKWLKTNWVLV